MPLGMISVDFSSLSSFSDKNIAFFLTILIGKQMIVLFCRNYSNFISVCLPLFDTIRCGSGNFNNCCRLWSHSRNLYRGRSFVCRGTEKLHVELMSRGMYNSPTEVTPKILFFNHSCLYKRAIFADVINCWWIIQKFHGMSGRRSRGISRKWHGMWVTRDSL